MTERPTTPRLEPLPADVPMDDDVAAMLGGLTAPDGSRLNIFGTLARHPGLFRKWMPFGGKLLIGKLPARDREILILRTAWNTQSEYEWGQHVTIGRRAGLSDDEIARIPGDAKTNGWGDDDAQLIAVADELHADAGISDASWKA